MTIGVAEQTWWFVARSTGLVAYVLLAVTVIGGLVLSSRLLRRPPSNALLDWHRFVGGLSVVFTGVHLLAIYADSYVEFGLADLFVPFLSSWRPLPVALGIVALYLVLAVELTSLLRRRLRPGLWRLIHQLSLPAFLLVTAHLLLAGTDASNPVVLVVVGALLAATAVLLALRLVGLGPHHGRGALRAGSAPVRRGPRTAVRRPRTGRAGRRSPHPDPDRCPGGRRCRRRS